MVKVGVVQARPDIGNKKANIKKMETYLKRHRCDIMVFPEMYLTGYSCGDELYRCAESATGHSCRSVLKLAEKYDTYVIFGMAERDEEQHRLYNAAVTAGPDGDLHTYRKMHLADFGPFHEHQFFSKGTEPVLIDTKLGKVGLTICYDIFFPELAKNYALKGAEMVVCISASPTFSRRFFECMVPARAIENTVFVLYSNLVGREKGLVFWGGSMVCGPRGDVKVQGEYYKEVCSTANINLKELEITRRFRPTIRDTSPLF